MRPATPRPATRAPTPTSAATSRVLQDCPPTPALADLARAAHRRRPGPHEHRRRRNAAAAHANTPTTAHFDTLGRPFLTVAHNRVVCPGHDLDGTEDSFATRVELDIEGNQRAVRDAVVQAGDALGRIVMRYDYDMLGNRIHQPSMEAGERWMLNDVTGKPIRAWDSRGHGFRTEYDALRRPTAQLRTGTIATQPATLTERLVDESSTARAAEPEAHNLRSTRPTAFDAPGVAIKRDYDFKGCPVTSRRLYRAAVAPSHVALPIDATEATPIGALKPRWYPDGDRHLHQPHDLRCAQPPDPDAPRTRRRAQQRHPTRSTTRPICWNGWTPGCAAARPTGLLVLPRTPCRRHQHRLRRQGPAHAIDYGNGASDRATPTTRTPSAWSSCSHDAMPCLSRDCPHPVPAERSCGLQNLHYTYDPGGNITHIQDDAQQTIYFRNKRVEPSADYTYDAVYRLIEATGREHLGQVGGAPDPPFATMTCRVSASAPPAGRQRDGHLRRALRV